MSAVMSLAIVTSSSGEDSLAIFAGWSASTVAGTQSSSTWRSSSSCSSQSALPAGARSATGGAAGPASAGLAIEAIGNAYLLFQNSSKDADSSGTMAPAATTSKS